MKRSVSLGVRRRGCIPKLLLAAMLVAIALVTSGCFISATWVFDPGVYQLTGTVFFGPKDLLMDGATVQLAEPYKDPFRLTQTNVDGRFSFSGVPEGIYTLTVDSRAGLERETVHHQWYVCSLADLRDQIQGECGFALKLIGTM
jgi:hypothetical protein